MQKKVEVFLQAQEEDAQEIQIPLESAKICSTIKSLIEDVEHNPAAEHITVSPPSVNSKLLSDSLIPCINAQQTGDPKNIINEKMNALSLDDLSSFIKAVNYLDIRPLFTKALAVAQEKLKTLRYNKRSISYFKNLNDIEHLLAYSLIKSYPIYKFISNIPKILKGNTGQAHKINLLCFSKDNKLLATANSVESTICVWDTQTGTCLKKLNDGRDIVGSFCFSADASLLASGHANATAKIWDIASGNCLRTFEEIYRFFMPNPIVWDVTFNHDGSLLAICIRDDRMVYLWDPKSGKHITELIGSGIGREHSATKCCFNNSSSILAAAYGGSIDLWDLKTYSRLIPTLLASTGDSPVKYLYFSADDKYLISGSAITYFFVSIWDTQTGRCLLKFSSAHLCPGCYNALNNKLVIYHDHIIDILDLNTLTINQSFTAGARPYNVDQEWLNGSAYFDTKRSYLMICSEFGNIYKGSLADNELPKDNSLTNIYQSYSKSHSGIRGNVSCFGEDGLLAIGLNDGTVQLFNFTDSSLENYLAHQLTIDQALFLISFNKKLIKKKKVLLCPYGHHYKIFSSLDERIKKVLERFIMYECSSKCQISHYKKAIAIGSAIGLTAVSLVFKLLLPQKISVPEV